MTETHVGAAAPSQFFAGSTEVTELYAGTTKIWSKTAPSLTATWDGTSVTNSKLVIPGTQLPSGTYVVDIPLWGDPNNSPNIGTVKIGYSQALATNPVSRITRIDGTSQVSPKFADMVYGLQGGRATLVIDNSFNATLTVTGPNPSIPAGFAATVLRRPDAWVPMNTPSGLYDMSGHRHPMFDRSVQYTTDGPVFPYGVKGHYVGNSQWLKLTVSSDITEFTISTWFIPKVVGTHQDSTSVVFGGLPFQSAPTGTFYFGEVDLGLVTAPATPGFKLMHTSGAKGMHPGADAAHINRWPQFTANAPYHIVLRSDKNVWINGEKRLHTQGGDASVPNMLISAVHGLVIGGSKEYSGAIYAKADGWMGNFAYWRRTLSDADIDAIYLAGRSA